MSYYLLEETMRPCEAEDLHGQTSSKYVAVLTTPEWERERERFDMGIELEPDAVHIHNTKAEVNYDSLTGTFQLPDRQNLKERDFRFAFALDEKGVVFIDDTGRAEQMIDAIRRTKRWRQPSLERFLYDFLEILIERDLRILIETEQELGQIEDEILEGGLEQYPDRLNEIRKFLMDLRIHYEQLLDFGQELEENENGFFEEVNLRYFRLFTERVMRLMDQVKQLRDYTVQLRELFSTQLDIRMNRIMTVLTIVTAIFMPLTLIAGWYGMNFVYMPELKWRYSYYVVFGVSLTILIGGIAWFRKRKWL